MIFLRQLANRFLMKYPTIENFSSSLRLIWCTSKASIKSPSFAATFGATFIGIAFWHSHCHYFSYDRWKKLNLCAKMHSSCWYHSSWNSVAPSQNSLVLNSRFCLENFPIWLTVMHHVVFSLRRALGSWCLLLVGLRLFLFLCCLFFSSNFSLVLDLSL